MHRKNRNLDFLTKKELCSCNQIINKIDIMVNIKKNRNCLICGPLMNIASIKETRIRIHSQMYV